MKQSEDKDFGRQNLLFRPKVPDVIDNQIQPHLPVDDSLKEEQIDKVPVKDMHVGAGATIYYLIFYVIYRNYLINCLSAL